MRHPAIAKSVSLPEPLYRKITELATSQSITFSQALGGLICKALGLDSQEYVTEHFRKRTLNAPRSSYAEMTLKAASIPLPQKFDDFMTTPIRPFHHYHQFINPIYGAKFVEIDMSTIDMSDESQFDSSGNYTGTVNYIEVPPTPEQRKILEDMMQKYGVDA